MCRVREKAAVSRAALCYSVALEGVFFASAVGVRSSSVHKWCLRRLGAARVGRGEGFAPVFVSVAIGGLQRVEACFAPGCAGCVFSVGVRVGYGGRCRFFRRGMPCVVSTSGTEPWDNVRLRRGMFGKSGRVSRADGPRWVGFGARLGVRARFGEGGRALCVSCSGRKAELGGGTPARNGPSCQLETSRYAVAGAPALFSPPLKHVRIIPGAAL